MSRAIDNKKISTPSLKTAVKNLCIIIQPFTPHLSEEIWEMLGYKGFCANTEWPELTKNDFVDTLKLPIQINGKLKGLVSIKKDEGRPWFLSGQNP